MSSKEIKQKIILMTIECIEQEGIQSATVRKIADMAEVNVAAINYYFGSKKQLFEIVMNTNLNESFVNNINDYEGMWNTDTHKALNNFLGDTLEGAVNYPNLTKAHFNEVFNKNNFESNSVQRLNNFLREFYELTRSELKQDDDLKSRIAISQLFSSILIIGMMPDLFKKFLN
nr:TetR/AcrR family transcriptional regulator [Candidatus Cloacimonadota bacterium]